MSPAELTELATFGLEHMVSDELTDVPDVDGVLERQAHTSESAEPEVELGVEVEGAGRSTLQARMFLSGSEEQSRFLPVILHVDRDQTLVGEQHRIADALEREMHVLPLDEQGAGSAASVWGSTGPSFAKVPF